MSSQKGLLACLMGLIILIMPGLRIIAAAPAASEYSPQANLPAATTAAATPAPTSTAALLEKMRGQPPLSLTLMLGFSICTLGLVAGVLLLGMIAGAQRPKEANGHQSPEIEQRPLPKKSGEQKPKGTTATGNKKKGAR